MLRAVPFSVRVFVFFLLLGAKGANAQFSYDLYYGSFDVLPDFSTLTPVESGSTNTISTAPSGQADNFGVFFAQLAEYFPIDFRLGHGVRVVYGPG